MSFFEENKGEKKHEFFIQKKFQQKRKKRRIFLSSNDMAEPSKGVATAT
jgi:hypothetical protein